MLSNSRIELALKCGAQYMFRYREGLVLPPSAAMVRGSAVDAAVTANLGQKISSGIDLPVDQVQQAARDALEVAFQGEIAADPDDESPGDMKATLVDAATSLAALHTQKIAPKIQPVLVQERIEMPPSALIPDTFVGVLDVVDAQDVIRDTKTRGKSSPRDAAETSDQLTAYDMLFRYVEGRAPAGLQFDELVRTSGGRLSVNELTSTIRSHSELEAYAARARQVLRMDAAEIYVPAPETAWYCSAKWCGWHSRCAYARGRKRPAT